jgi:orotate phosphoribosyltransferase
VDRSGGELPDFGCPFIALTKLDVETFAPDAIPADLAGIPATKPGSK